MKNVCMIGLGYIGLPTAIVAADHGFRVIGYDIDPERVRRINEHEMVMVEPEIDHKLQEALYSGRFRAQTNPAAATYFVIAVPTPHTQDKKADLSHVFHAARAIAPFLQKDNVVILESTVPVGTTEQLAKLLEELTGLKAGQDFFCAHCPERVLPGKIFYELTHNARIIGGINERSAEQAQRFYERFVKAPLFITSAATAEMVKLVENSSRDVGIAFAHEVAALATAAGLDPYEVVALANKHPRVRILQPRCGVGGHCIAVDPWFLIETFPAQSRLIKMARQVNDDQPERVYKRIMAAAKECATKKRCKVLILGLTYKPDIDDLRESPALAIAKRCARQRTIELLVCDPYVADKELGLEQIDFQKGLAVADLVVCLVSHKLFKIQIESIRAHENVLDACGLLYVDAHADPRFFPAESIDPADMLEGFTMRDDMGA